MGLRCPFGQVRCLAVIHWLQSTFLISAGGKVHCPPNSSAPVSWQDSPVQGRILKLLWSPQHMVMSFRVSELQVLLGFAGRNKSGRKHELLAKALHLLKSSCAPSVQMKIKELYRRRFPRKTLGPSDLSLLSLPPGTPPVGSPGPLAPIPPALLAPGTLLGPKREVDMHPPLPQPVHPDVTMKPLPFYEIYGELIRPTTLGMALCGPWVFLDSVPLLQAFLRL